MDGVREQWRVRAPNLYTSNRTTMDSVHSHNLTHTERENLQHKIQRLEWLLTECIGLEEYELCSQIKTLIQRKYELLTTNHSTNEIE